jgi:hypothetical protein
VKNEAKSMYFETERWLMQEAEELMVIFDGDKVAIYTIIAQFSYEVKLLQFPVSWRRSNLPKHPATEIATPAARNDEEVMCH